MRSPERHEVLLDRAVEDAYTVERWSSDPGTADTILGFHAQQAVEKFLKAVLSKRGIAYPYTHNLAHLLDLLRANGIDVPDELSTVRGLSPYGAERRYADMPPEPEGPLDRSWAVDCVRRTREWAEPLLADVEE